MKKSSTVKALFLLLFLCLIVQSLEVKAQCNFSSEYTTPFGWQSVGTTIGISGGSLNFNQTPGSPQTEHFYRQTVCPLNDDNWQAQFSFQLDTGNLMGHALLFLSNNNTNPSSSPGIGAYIFSDASNPTQLILVAQDNSNFYTSLGGPALEIEQDSIYHIVLERVNMGAARLSVFKDSLRQNPVAGSPIDLSFPGQNIVGLDYVIHGNNDQLPGVDFLTGAIEYLDIKDGCSAKIIGQDTVCSGQNFTYELNTANSYQWNTGESSRQITRSFSADQMLIGTITDTNQCSASDTLQIKVFDMPNAAFTASDYNSSKVPFNVNFTNNSTNANKWFWDFGDGNTSTDENPSHTYNSYGDFTVSLVAIDSSSGCADTAYAQINIEVISADFTSEATVGCGSTVIQFEDLSTGPITNWFWVFGNGSISTDRNPVAIYPNPGTYQVSLTVTDGVNTDTKTINGYIEIGTEASAPIVQFTADTTTSCTNDLSVQFTDQSQNAAAWFWEFGDGDTSHQQNPQHYYDSAGDYSVKLQVTNTLGCVRDTTYEDYIVIDPPRADFNASPSNACGPFTTNFEDLSYSADSIVSWFWDFGDGQTGNTQNPTHLYASTGVYLVTLTIEDENACSDSFTDTLRSGSIKPDADFTAAPSRVCIGEPVQFTDQSIDANQWFWDFGDGGALITQQNPVYSFADTGDYTVTLIACNDGCCDTISKMQDIEVIEPIAVFSADEPIGCSVPHQVQFSDESFSPSNWSWDFGDGNTSSQQNPQHTYQNIGMYTVTLIVQDTITLCQDTFTSNINIDTAQTNFAAFPLNGCTPLLVQFADNSRNPVAWNWDFGNGSTATVRNPLHTYVDSGSYDITLVTEIQNGCRDTLVRSDMITVVEPDIQISASVQSGCAPLTVDFENLTNGTANQFWDFGNGDTSDLKSPTVTFTQPGIYDITLQVEDINGCSNTEIFTQYIEVFDLPELTVSEDTAVCFGSQLDIFASGADTYNWNNGLFGDSIRLTIYTDSTLILTAIDSNSCQGTDTVNIEAMSLPNASAGANDSVCLGESGTLNASGGDQYLWNEGTSTAQLTETVAVTTLFTVEVTDSNSCTASDSAYIVVRPQPIADAGNNDTICLGETGQLIGSGSGNLSWSNGNTGSLMLDSPLVTTDYVLTVTDVYNCRAFDTASIFVDDFTSAGILKADTICEGDTAVLEALGGVDYQWSNGSFDAEIFVTPVSNTVYRVTITNDLGCTLTDSVEVVVNPLPNLNIPDASFCLGGYTILDANIGSGASYLWSTGSTTDTIKVHSAGEYTVIAESSFGCQAFDTVQTSVDTALVVELISDSLCDGQVHILDAGNPGASYLWNTGDTTQTIEVDQSGTFTVEVTDPFGCMGFDTADVFFFPRPLADAGADKEICEGDTALLIASGAVDYEWSNGISSDSNYVAPLSNTVYSVIVTDSNGCKDTASVNVQVNPLPVVSAGADVEACFGDTLTLNASGAVNYIWSNGVAQAQNTIIALQDSMLIVQASDTNFCDVFDTVNVFVNPLPVADAGQSDSICLGDTTMLVASGGAFYQWSNGFSNDTIFVSPVNTSIYRVSVSDSFGCTAVDSVEVFVKPVPVANAGSDQQICFGDSVQLTASGGDAYLWSTGDTSAQIKVAPTTDQDYVLEAINNFGCTDFDTVLVEVESQPQLVLTPDTAVCEGSFVELNVSGAATYSWSNGASGSSISVQINLDTVFSVTGTNTFGCVSQDSVEIQSIAPPVISVSNDTAVCIGSTVVLEASGAVNYLWSNGNSGAQISINPLNSNYYTVSANDVKGCTTVDSVYVEVYELPVFELNDQTFCTGGGTTLPGPSGDSQYNWNTGDTSQHIFVNTVGVYTLSVTDSNLCSYTDTAEVSDSSVLVIAIPDQDICYGQTAVLDAGYPDAQHQWSTGDTGMTMTTDSAGIFTVYVQDTFGCEGFDTVEVNLFSNPAVFIGSDTAVCEGTALGFAYSPVGTSIWNGMDTNSVFSFSAATDTMLTIQYIDTNSCQGFDTVNIGVYENPDLELFAPDSACQNSEISLLAAGNGDLKWFNNDTTTSTEVTLSQSNYFWAELTDSNTCVTRDSVFVKALQLPQPNAGVDTFVCSGDTINISGSAGVGNLVFWNTGDSTLDISLSPAQSHNLVFFEIDSNNCLGSDTALLEVSALPAITFNGLKSKYCIGDTIAVLDIQPSNGNLSGVGISGFTFDPNAVPLDSTLTLRYEITDTFGCSNSSEKQTIVYPLPEPELSISDTGFCENLTPVSLSGAPFGGQFKGPGVSNDIFIPFYAGVGRHMIQYVFSDINQCVAADSQYVTVYPLPQPAIDTLPEEVCVDAPALEIGLSHTGGTLQGKGLSGDSLFVPSQAGVGGPYALVYSYTDSNNCSNFTFHEITVKALPVLNFTGVKDVYCEGMDTVLLSASPEGGYFSGLGVDSSTSTLVFDSVLKQSTLSYHYYDSSSSCANSISKTVQQSENPEVNFVNATDSFCADVSFVELRAEPAGGIFSGSGVNNDVFRPQTLVADSSYTLKYTYTDSNNCRSEASATYYIHALPEVAILNEDSFYCQGEIQLVASPEGGYFTGAGQYNGVLYPKEFAPG
ncbi:MAG: PKD domain-containing protein, partial [Chitinophagales bacterium]